MAGAWLQSVWPILSHAGTAPHALILPLVQGSIRRGRVIVVSKTEARSKEKRVGGVERDKKWNESLRRSTRVYTFLFPRLKTGLRNRTASQPHYAAYLTSTETDSASAAESPGLHKPENQGSTNIYVYTARVLLITGERRSQFCSSDSSTETTE